MKTIIATGLLFFTAGVCFAGGQPTQQRGKLRMTELLTYNNFSCQKVAKNNAPKVYVSQESAEDKIISQSSIQYNNQTSPQTFTPTPLVNFYKEFR